MTARGTYTLLPPDKLGALLYQRARDVDPKTLAREYDLTLSQVHSLINYNRKRIMGLRVVLGKPAALPRGCPKGRVVPLSGNGKKKPWPYRKTEDTREHKCLNCERTFFTDSKFMRLCKHCHSNPDYQSGMDYTTVARRGTG